MHISASEAHYTPVSSPGSDVARLGLKKKVFDWRNPTDPRYPAYPRYFNNFFQKKEEEKKEEEGFFPLSFPMTHVCAGSIFNHFQTSNQNSVLKNK